jgi:hypothetical protein
VNEEAPCNQPELSRFHLIVFGASGCSGFELRPGAPVDVEAPVYAPAP